MSRDSSNPSWADESRADRQSRMHSDGWSKLSGDDDDDEDPAPRRTRRRGRGMFGLWVAVGVAVLAGGLLVMLVRYLRMA